MVLFEKSNIGDYLDSSEVIIRIPVDVLDSLEIDFQSRKLYKILEGDIYNHVGI